MIYGLNDPLDPWFGEDKVQHFGWAAAVYAHGYAFGGWRQGALELLAGSLLVTAIELWRWIRWQAKGFPQPWPFLADKISLKDMMVELLGALVMHRLLP